LKGKLIYTDIRTIPSSGMILKRVHHDLTNIMFCAGKVLQLILGQDYQLEEILMLKV